MEIEARIPSAPYERSHMQDVLTKQIAIRGDPSRCDYIIAARESSPAITIRHHRSDPFVHLALRQAYTTHTRSLIILPVLLFLLPDTLPSPLLLSLPLSALRTLDINTDTSVRICMLAERSPRACMHTPRRGWVQLVAHTCVCMYICMCVCARARAYARTFNPRLMYVLRNARPVSTASRDNDEGDEEVDGGNVH